VDTIVLFTDTVEFYWPTAGRRNEAHMSGTDKNGKHDKELTITIDGRPFVTRDDNQEAAALLGLAGLDPEQYDLGEIKNGETKRFNDGKLIKLRDGDAFVSIRQMATVA
jgi:hypothetical protein